jgi:hypothetical protein
MSFWKERDIVFTQTPNEAELVKERWHQVGVVGLGIGTYFLTHRFVKSTSMFRNRPFVVQFVAVWPAMAVMYVEGVRMRWKTLKGLRF